MIPCGSTVWRYLSGPRFSARDRAALTAARTFGPLLRRKSWPANWIRRCRGTKLPAAARRQSP